MRNRSGLRRSRRSAMRARRRQRRLRPLRLRAESLRRLRFSEQSENQRAWAPALHKSEGASWLTRRKHLLLRLTRRQRRKDIANVHLPGARALAADQAARVKADASIFAARRFASFASRRLKTSTTRTCGYSRSSWQRAARSCRAG